MGRMKALAMKIEAIKNKGDESRYVEFTETEQAYLDSASATCDRCGDMYCPQISEDTFKCLACNLEFQIR